MEGIGRPTPSAASKKTDRAREAYVKRYYNCDARDPSCTTSSSTPRGWDWTSASR